MRRAARGAALMLVLAVAAPAQADRPASDAYVRRAEAALARGRPRDARIELLNAIEEDPGSGGAHLLQASVHLRLGDGTAAQAAIERARGAGVPAARTHHLLAHAYLLQNDPQRALDECDPAHVPQRFRAYALRVRGQALFALGDAAAASRAFGDALDLAPRDADLWVDLGRFRLATGEVAGAIEAADRAVALGRRNGAALLLKGELARSQYGLAAAMPWFDRALAVDPHDVPALLARAATLGDMGRAREMLAATRAALAIEDRNPQAFYLQAVLAARARNFALARSLIERTGGALDGVPGMLLLKGAVDLQLRNFEQSIAGLSRLVALQPDNVQARRLLALAQWRAGDFAQTIGTLDPIVRGGDGYSLILAARAHERLGDRGKAALYLDRAADPASGLLILLPASDDLAVLERAVAHAPAAALPRVALIRGLLRGGRAAEALANAQLLQRSNPGAPAAHMLAGDVLAAQGQFAAAAEDYRRAANISFTEPVALRLVDALRRSGAEVQAGVTLSLFLGQNPRSIGGRLMAADRMLGAGAFQRAGGVLEGLRSRLGDRDPALLNNLAWAAAESGKGREALALVRHAHGLVPANPALAHSYGWLLIRTGANRARGISLIEQAVALAPQSAIARWHLALAYAAAGRPADARAQAEFALSLPGFAEAGAARALLARL